MALTDHQRGILALLATHRIEPQESYLAGGTALTVARDTIAALPTEEIGTCVLDAGGRLFQGGPEPLGSALRGGALRFHRGTIRGSVPRFIDR